MGLTGSNDPYAVSDDVDLNNQRITIDIPQLRAPGSPDLKSAVERISADNLPDWEDG